MSPFIITADLETRLDNFLIRNILNYHSQDVGWVIDADGGRQHLDLCQRIQSVREFLV